MRIFLAIVAVNLALVGVVVAADQLWPSLLENEEDSAYVCKTLDNGLDAPYTPVRVCISSDDISADFACEKRPDFVLGDILLVYDPSYDTFCALELPQK